VRSNLPGSPSSADITCIGVRNFRTAGLSKSEGMMLSGHETNSGLSARSTSRIFGSRWPKVQATSKASGSHSYAFRRLGWKSGRTSPEKPFILKRYLAERGDSNPPVRFPGHLISSFPKVIPNSQSQTKAYRKSTCLSPSSLFINAGVFR